MKIEYCNILTCDVIKRLTTHLLNSRRTSACEAPCCKRNRSVDIWNYGHPYMTSHIFNNLLPSPCSTKLGFLSFNYQLYKLPVEVVLNIGSLRSSHYIFNKMWQFFLSPSLKICLFVSDVFTYKKILRGL